MNWKRNLNVLYDGRYEVMNEFETKTLETLAYELPDEILKYRMCGDLAGAEAAIDRWLDRPVAEGLKARLVLEKEFLAHLPKQFPYTKQQAIALFQDLIPDFGVADLERLDRAGYAEWVFLNGEKHYIHNLVRNVLRVDEEIVKRMGEADSEKEERVLLKATIADVKEKGRISERFRLRTSIRLEDGLFRPGMKVKVHLPIPAELHQISDVKILAHSEGNVTIDQPDSLYRAICFEDTLQENREFFVEYEYTVTSVYHDFSGEDFLKAENSLIRDETAHSLYTAEQYPHIRFSPYLKALAAQIVGDEKEPLAIARKIYDYITAKVKYSYMREYFLIEEIPQYCARNLRGDCGVQALLFITLCRICGVPAKWQSGLYAIPGSVGPHDWAMFYVEPYGWLYADPSFGGSAYRDGDEARRSFYFGNLDPFRMVANNAFQQPFASPKRFLPIDPYDNQIGEIESEERGFGNREVVTEQEMIWNEIL